MARRVAAHLNQLKKLKTCKEKERRKVLVEGGKPLQLCLQECCINIMNGNVPLTTVQKAKLKRHKEKLLALRKKKTSHQQRLKIEQRGGFLPALIAPVLGALVAGIFKKK